MPILQLILVCAVYYEFAGVLTRTSNVFMSNLVLDSLSASLIVTTAYYTIKTYPLINFNNNLHIILIITLLFVFFKINIAIGTNFYNKDTRMKNFKAEADKYTFDEVITVLRGRFQRIEENTFTEEDSEYIMTLTARLSELSLNESDDALINLLPLLEIINSNDFNNSMNLKLKGTAMCLDGVVNFFVYKKLQDAELKIKTAFKYHVDTDLVWFVLDKKFKELKKQNAL